MMATDNVENLDAGYIMGKNIVNLHDFKGNRALDIGCGYASHTVAYADVFNEVDAIDVETSMSRDYLRTLSPSADKITFIHEDIHNFLIIPDRYDLIYSLSALEHINNWQTIVTDIPKRLTKGGLFNLIISPLYYSPTGHHLYPMIGDWEHILLPEDELKEKFFKKEGPQWAWDIYLELNRLTASEFLILAKTFFETVYLEVNIKTIHYVGRRK